MERDQKLEESIRERGTYLETADSATESTVYPVDEVLWAGKSAFVEEMVLAKSGPYGRMLFTDGELQSVSADETIYHEHLVHPSVLMHRFLFEENPSEPLSVLVLGGGEGATVRELLKYPSSIIGKVVWNDIDNTLVDLCQEHLGYGDGKYFDEIYNVGGPGGRVERVYKDANTYLPDLVKDNQRFDIVVNDLPDPGEKITALTGLYSSKFFADMHAVLKDHGVIVTHAGPTKPNQFQVADFLKKGLENAGFSSQFLIGLVPIPSFQSEWGYIYGAKFSSQQQQQQSTKLEYNSATWKVNDEGMLPQDLNIIDDSALSRFFAIPNYYFRK